jgi:hypothetical protein
MGRFSRGLLGLLFADSGLDLGALPDGDVEHHRTGEHVRLLLIDG